ncbi:hypothetical protein [Maribacter hydrothermalis]|uniref:Uncharacterized protein n=1 Tax=Maribacter hydrothermalis TaxID=1836467 RepID=A0A1B7Z986_9FLAO|nr:hypothetical protein [Maribacter hydrothermalis]APQ18857.1 hypothetical protein BTR34_16710 [Maribacter hydrothermalis]OBR39130.1 hypothetical protein A9200_05565 [Maribacter hydrothermalis]
MSILKDKKYKQLFMGLLFDGIGMLSFAIPFVGEFSDIVWAPLSGYLMTRMYKGKVGQAAGVFTFIEEIIPGFDIIPSFTLMWLYTYVFKSAKKGKTIEV